MGTALAIGAVDALASAVCACTLTDVGHGVLAGDSDPASDVAKVVSSLRPFTGLKALTFEADVKASGEGLCRLLDYGEVLVELTRLCILLRGQGPTLDDTNDRLWQGLKHSLSARADRGLPLVELTLDGQYSVETRWIEEIGASCDGIILLSVRAVTAI